VGLVKEMDDKNPLVGIIAIILGLIIIVSPLTGLAAIGLISGLILLIVGIWFLTRGMKERKYEKISWLFLFIFGLIGIILGIYFLLNLYAVETFGIWIYIITGLMLLVAGFVIILRSKSDSRFQKMIGISGVIIGIIYLLVGYFKINPIVIGVIIGLALLGYGILRIR
jgi:uncharacterized membrane protein HdeD (DUF308 family)